MAIIVFVYRRDPSTSKVLIYVALRKTQSAAQSIEGYLARFNESVCRRLRDSEPRGDIFKGEKVLRLGVGIEGWCVDTHILNC